MGINLLINKITMAQTSVEWLVEQLMERDFIKKNYEIIEQAKEMHKKETIRFVQTMPAYIEISQECKPYVKYDAEAHYNQTYGK